MKNVGVKKCFQLLPFQQFSDVLVSVRPDPTIFPELVNFDNCDEENLKPVNW